MSGLEDLDIVLRTRSGKVTAAIPDLKLFATAATREAALEMLDKKRATLLEDLRQASFPNEFTATDQLAGARPTTTGPVGHTGIGQFAAKAVIVIGLVAASTIVSGMLIADRVSLVADRFSAQYGTIGGRQFWSKVDHQLADLADPKTDLSEEKKQELLLRIRTIVTRWRPFVAEFASIFAVTPAPAPRPGSDSK